MIDRNVVDLRGYSTPEIAHSKACNGDRIRNNPEYFLSAKPDIYWPYQFSGIMDPAVALGTFDNAEKSLATFHHSSKWGNILGDMTRVMWWSMTWSWCARRKPRCRRRRSTS